MTNLNVVDYDILLQEFLNECSLNEELEKNKEQLIVPVCEPVEKTNLARRLTGIMKGLLKAKTADVPTGVVPYKGFMIDYIRLKDIEQCGNSVTVLKDEEGKYYAKATYCKDHLCPVCGAMQLENLREQVLYYTYKCKMGDFFTLTTKGDLQELESAISLIHSHMRSLNHDYFVDRQVGKTLKRDLKSAEKAYSKGKIEGFSSLEDYLSSVEERLVNRAERAYKANINKMIKFEVYYQLSLYFSSDIGISISTDINNGVLTSYPASLYKGVRYVDILNKRQFLDSFPAVFKDKLRGRINAFKRGLIVITEKETGTKLTYEKFYKRAKSSVTRNLNSDLPFSFIRFLEYQENGNPHYHILSNFYYNHWIVQTVLANFKNTKIYKDDNLRTLNHGDRREVQEAITSYVTKYVTKETLENVGGLKGVYSSSQNISIVLKMRKTSDKSYTRISRLNRKARSSWEEIPNGDVESYEKKLSMPSVGSYHPNPYIANIQKLLESNNKDVEAYVTLHRKDKKGVSEFKKEKGQEFIKYKQEQQTRALVHEYEKRRGVKCKSLKLKADADLSGLTDEQLSFLNGLLNGDINYLFLLGSAGTGKTYALSRILDCIDWDGLRVEICTFAGKASARVNELLKIDRAMTMHRLMNARKSSFLSNFLNDETNPLDVDVVFIDEVSMVDKYVFSCLLNALPRYCKVVMIGDIKQLLPVGSNCLISEFALLKKHYIDRSIDAVKLTINQRQKDAQTELQQMITKISDGKIEKDDILKFNLNEIIDKVLNEDVQVICNSNRLVKKISKALQKKKEEMGLIDITETVKYKYQTGDKVLILQNDKENGLFNGDIVEIIGHDEIGVTLKKNDKLVNYSYYKSAMMFVPAILTCHKSQGSEMDNVIVVLDDKTLLSNKNLLYTAATRAKKTLKVYGVDGLNIELLKHSQVSDDTCNVLTVIKNK